MVFARRSAIAQPSAPHIRVRSSRWRSRAQLENKVEAACRRGDLFEKRRHLMGDCARFCEASPPGEVVPLRAGA